MNENGFEVVQDAALPSIFWLVPTFKYNLSLYLKRKQGKYFSY